MHDGDGDKDTFIGIFREGDGQGGYGLGDITLLEPLVHTLGKHRGDLVEPLHHEADITDGRLNGDEFEAKSGGVVAPLGKQGINLATIGASEGSGVRK